MTIRHRCIGAALAGLSLWPVQATPQELSQRGFIETRALVYLQDAERGTTRAIADLLVRYEPSVRLWPWLRLSAALDARLDTRGHVRRAWTIDWQDRTPERPALSVRRLEAIASRGRISVDLGKQVIRWGKADLLNPTDRFAPRDFLEVTDNEFLGVTAVKGTYEDESNTIETVWVPRVTPSRIPLFTDRWAVLPEQLARASLVDRGARVPEVSQLGVHWNHLSPGYEFSLSFFDGVNHLPLIEGRVAAGPPVLELRRVFPDLRMYGGDAALPLRWVTLKGEAAYFTGNGAARNGSATDDYLLYVVQLERQAGEWSVVGGYAGELVTERRATFEFAPDRGLTRSFLGRAGYTIDVRRSIAVEGAVRQNGDGIWVKLEYSHASGEHWRGTAGGTWIGGEADDFLGQYRRNSHVTLVLRYSF